MKKIYQNAKGMASGFAWRQDIETDAQWPCPTKLPLCAVGFVQCWNNEQG